MIGMMKLSKITPLQIKTINIMLRENKKYKNKHGHEPTSEELSKILNIPEEEIIVAVIALGKKDIDAKLNPRKDVDEVLIIK